MMKGLWLSIVRTFGHASLLPLAVATFVSVAGPGGFAEIGRDVTGVPTLAVVSESAPVVADEQLALLVSAIHAEPPAAVLEVGAPEAVKNPIESLSTETVAADTPEEVVSTVQVPEEVTQPAPPDAPPAQDDEPVVDPGTPEQPADSPPEDGSEDAGDTGDTPPADDTGSGDPPADIPGDGTDEPVCDPPGTGPAPHDGVPPGHDQNGDGIDDRCQENQDPGDGGTTDGGTTDGGTTDGGTTDGGTTDGSTTDGGTTDGSTTDGGTTDGGTTDGGTTDGGTTDGGTSDQPVCDPPGNGHENHGTPPPGHDKNGDGIDDRCQEGVVRAAMKIEGMTDDG